MTTTRAIQPRNLSEYRRAPLLTYDENVRFLTWPAALEALRRGHRLARPHVGDLLIGPATAALLNRAAYIEDLGYVVKAETVFRGNAARGLPSVQGLVLLYHAETGSIRAIIDSKLVTEYKTAADSVLAAKLLARTDSRHLLIVGAGTVASSLARAYSAIFPELERVSIWARRPEQAKTLIDSLGEVETDLTIASDLKLTAQTADIISTATMSRQPILFGDWIRPGTHVDLIGGFTPDMREADDDLIARAQLFVDCRETTIDYVGDLTQPIAAGAIDRDHVQGDLYDLVASTSSRRRSESSVTVFKNGGGAHLDLMIAAYIASVFEARCAISSG